MPRQIVYLSGSGSPLLMDQSAPLIADRIARSLVDKLRHRSPPVHYRVKPQTDVTSLASDIGVDIASIEFLNGGRWQPEIDILEIKYLRRFARPVARLTALARAGKALYITLSYWRKSRYAKGAAPCAPRLRTEDKKRVRQLKSVSLALAGYLILWVILAAVAGIAVVGAVGVNIEPGHVWPVIAIALFAGLAETVRKNLFEPYEPWAAEAFSSAAYQLDDRGFRTVPNAILDGIEYARQRADGPVDLFGFSLGSLLTADAIFPRQQRQQVWSPSLSIENWITAGFPHYFIEADLPGYFADRRGRTVRFEQWLNIVVLGDFLGTDFEQDRERGIHVAGADGPYRPQSVTFKPEEPGEESAQGRTAWWHSLNPKLIARKHRIYWDDQDPRAPTCFGQIADAAGWTQQVAESLGVPSLPAMESETRAGNNSPTEQSR
jgi:hypothetical protein